METREKKYYDYGIPMTKDFEGFRDKIYLDTNNNRTIGYGFNLEDRNMRSMLPAEVVSGQRPITRKEADAIFVKRYNQAAKDALDFIGLESMLRLDPYRQAILVDMAYNLGPNKLSEFKNMQAAVQSGDYMKAAAEMKNSRWYNQTGRRSKHHVLKFSK
jgi:lysozyme